MALSATGVFEVRTDGNDDNAGYFNPGGASAGTDYSQQAAAEVTIDGTTVTAAVHTTTTQINITGATVADAWNRNGLRITGGDATAGLYEITAVDTANNRITVDRAAGTAAQTVVGRMGGALGSPGGFGSDHAALGIGGQVCWIKSGNYTLTSASSNVSGGVVAPRTSTRLIIEGYQTTRGDRLAKPVILVPDTGTFDSIIVYTGSSSSSAAGHIFINLAVDGQSRTTRTGLTGFSAGTIHGFLLCSASNCDTGFAGPGRCFFCEASACTIGFLYAHAYGCTVSYCTGDGFQSSDSASTVNCLSYGNVVGFSSAATVRRTLTINCIAYENSSHGFDSGTNSFYYFGCIAVSNGGWGFNNLVDSMLVDCATYLNTSGAIANRSNPLMIGGEIELTADPFLDAANDKFSLNNTVGGGAVLRARNFVMNADTSAYPFRWIVSDDFGGGAGGGFIQGSSGRFGVQES
jgi:hypothetical protein